MAIFRKKKASSDRDQGNNPDPAMFAGASIWEKLEREESGEIAHYIFCGHICAAVRLDVFLLHTDGDRGQSRTV